MKLDDIMDLWSIHCKIDKFALVDEVLRINELHYKYYKIYLFERRMLNDLRKQLKLKSHALRDTYSNPTQMDWANKKDRIPNRTILKTDLPGYVETDPEYLELSDKIQIQELKIDTLESIVSSINQRSFQINTAVKYIEWKGTND